LYLAKRAGRDTWRGLCAPEEPTQADGTFSIVAPNHGITREPTA